VSQPTLGEFNKGFPHRSFHATSELKVKPAVIDGNLLRKENWGHGKSVFKYQSITNSAFRSPEKSLNRDEL
jgi:hypothetical protein